MDYKLENRDIKKQVTDIVEEYRKSADKEFACPNHLPDKDEVIEITETLRKILFPGYFDKSNTNIEHIEYYVGTLLIQADKMLQRQIYRALSHCTVDNEDNGALLERASALTTVFLSKLPAIRQILLTDVQATLDGDPAASNIHEIIFSYPGLYTISIFRLAHELHILGIPLIPRMMTEHAHSLTGIDIHPGAEISHHFFIDHGTGIVIGETTRIGAHVKLYQGVTLGALSTRGGQRLRGKKRHPTIEDDVTIYSSTSILGGETVIGKGSVIASNVFITQTVPANTRVNVKKHELDFKDI